MAKELALTEKGRALSGPYMKQLNFSDGSEPVVFVNFEGRSALWKQTFQSEAAGVAGVTRVVSAGGESGAYVYFDAATTNEDAVSAALTTIAQDI